MSSFTDPSSIVLIAGTLCIFVFVLHGLWFSNHPKNRKLNENSKRDQELEKSNQIGKVRIVSPDVPKADDDLDIGLIKHTNEPAGSKKASITFPENERPRSSLANDMGIKEVSSDDATKMQMRAAQMQQQKQQEQQWQDIYEIILVADPRKPYLGKEIENICNEYGFLPGFLQDNLKIFFVYENTQTRSNEVFRICSMEEPYYFPENMEEFQTSALALYMNLPEPGKGSAYFRALRMAAEIFVTALGGQMQGPDHRLIDEMALASMEAGLQKYDATAASARPPMGA